MSQAFTEFPTLEGARRMRLDAFAADNPFGVTLGDRLTLQDGYGEGRRDFLSFARGIRAAYSRFRPSRDIVGNCEGQDLFKLHFSLEGRNVLRYAHGAEELVPVPSLSMSLHPTGLRKLDCHPREVWEHSLTFTCRHAALAELIAIDPADLPAPVRRFVLGGDAQLYCKTLPLPARVARSINALLAPDCDPRVAHLHAEARVLDLLCLALDHLVDWPDHRLHGSNPTARQVRALNTAREQLERQFLAPVSIGLLARSSGLSRTRLTEGFRSLFGESVGECLARLRMQHAKRMLEDGHTAAAVSAELGYRHQSSFSTAFRTYFGKAPSMLRARRRSHSR